MPAPKRALPAPAATVDPNAVRAIDDLDSLLDFLSISLGWQLDLEADIEDLTFEWTPDELGLTPEQAQRLQGGIVRQLRLPHASAPWGIFVVEFAQQRVSVTALRQALRGLVERKGKDPSQRSWAQEDLLFLCITRDPKTSLCEQFTFAHFRRQTSAGIERPAVLSTFGWSTGDASLHTLCDINLPALEYPADPLDAQAWREKWRGAFDVEKVTQKFFEEYGKVFAEVEESIVGVAEGDKRLYTQRLFNRLMFLYFIERKTWLEFDGKKNYLRALWNKAEEPEEKESYLNDRLYWAFFCGLGNSGDNPAGHDEAAFQALRGVVPFLNGGLFDLEEPYDVRDKKGLPLVSIPNGKFEKILGLFERFNFTVEESTPQDVAVAVDPEMLGKVFEELVTKRHETGSYYTPRPVVAFMCREALKSYLAPAEADASAIARFVDEDDASRLRDPEQVLEALKRVKVCDPACGSGAYLLGMMQELLRLRERLLAQHKIDDLTIYRKKLEIIGQNLYGVDIDRFAVNVAMLRLWLSLVVDLDDNTPLDRLPALPNLNYKIACGDSLSAPDPQASDLLTKGGDYEKHAARLAVLHDENFLQGIRRKEGRTTRAKSEIEGDITALNVDIAGLFGDTIPKGALDWRSTFAEVFTPRAPQGADGARLILDKALEPGGFDIVLANPPYVRMELFKDAKPTLRANFPHVHAERADLYVYFYARALQLLRPGGMLVFISSNKWFRAGYGAKLREHFAKTTHVHSITDFGDLPVFQKADAYPMIFIAQKYLRGEDNSKRVHVARWTLVKSLDAPYPDVKALVVRDGHLLPEEALSGSEWTLADVATAKHLQTIRADGVPLGKYVNNKIYRGVVTGFNKAFIIDEKTRKELLASNPASKDVIKPLLVGKNIRKWSAEPGGKWLLYLPHGVDISKFPAVVEHLRPYRKQLEQRATKQEWYELQQPQAKFISAFEQPKILYPVITSTSPFSFDTSGSVTNDKAFVIPVGDLYLLGVLNSDAAWLQIRAICSSLLNGFWELRSVHLSQIIIPDAPAPERLAIAALVQKCLDAKGVGCEAWEAEINERVAKLYGL